MADSQENKDHNPSQENSTTTPCTTTDRKTSATGKDPGKSVEHGGPKGLEPTRYGDWERNGRCTDF